MQITITIEEDDLTVGAYIEGVEKPTEQQAQAMSLLAEGAGLMRHMLFEEADDVAS